MPYYLDSSAFLKLLVDEDDSDAMRGWFARGLPCCSSQLLLTESIRAAARLGVPVENVERLLPDVSLVLPALSTFRRAAMLAPVELRSPDALHLATASELSGDLNALVAYDRRMLAGARALGLPTHQPG